MSDDDFLYRAMDEDDPLYMGDDCDCRKISKRKNDYKSSKKGCAGILLFGIIGILCIMIVL
jgi:hypothetical protein